MFISLAFHIFLFFHSLATFLRQKSSYHQNVFNDLMKDERNNCKVIAKNLVLRDKKLNKLYLKLKSLPKDNLKNRKFERSQVIRDIFHYTNNQYVSLEICRLADRESKIIEMIKR